MPQAVVAVAAVAASASVAAYVGWATGSVFLMAAARVATFAIVAGVLGEKLSPKPRTPSFEQASYERKQMIRQPIVTWRTLYGESRISGAITFAHQTDNNTYFNILITLCAHEVAEIGEVYLNDEIAVDASGTVVAKYSGYVEVWKGLGTTAGDNALLSALQTNSPGKWTVNHKQSGHAKLYIRFKQNRDLFPSGVPNISAWVRGKKVYDPRTAATVWSENPALCIRDYLLNTKTGLGATSGEISDTYVNAAANTCEEQVAVVQTAQTFTADAAADKLTLAAQVKGLRTGNGVRVSTAGTLPGGLAPATTYYWVRVSATTGKLATSHANALAGAAIDLTSAGSGTHTLTRMSEARYACDGIVDSKDKPKDILESLKGAMAGRLVYIGGKWLMHAGSYRTPTETLDESWLDGPIRVQTRLSRRDLCNRVKGLYVDPDQSWQPTDFPPVVNATYLGEDNNEQIFKDLDLAYTLSPSTSQRIAKQELEATRQQITTTWPCNLKAMKVMAAEVVGLTNSRMGWTNKPFEIVNFAFAIRDENDAPRLGVDLLLRETAPGVYDWNSGEETTVDLAPNTNLPNPFIVAAPTNLALASGTAELYRRLDGTIFSRIKATWTAPADAFVTSGGTIETQYKESSGATWLYAMPVPGDQTVAYILDVKDGVGYDVRVRSVNSLGGKSAWTAVTGHTVAGKTVAPTDVTGLSAQQNGAVVTYKWSQVADADLAGYELRYMAAPFAWANATVLTAVTRGTLVTNTGLPPGAWVVGIKARDTSGNYSTNATTFSITVTNSNDVVYQSEQYPNWPGTLTNMVMHPTRVLVPDSQTLASGMTDAQLWDQMVHNPYSSPYYEAPEADVGFDAEGVRVYAKAVATLGPGETGAADPRLMIDYKLAAGAYDGFEPWTVGFIAARYVKARIGIDSASGVAYVGGFKPVFDVVETTQAANGVAISAGGTTITFSPRYHQTPSFTATAAAVAGAARFATYESLSATGVTVRVFNAAGDDAGGTINWQATGV